MNVLQNHIHTKTQSIPVISPTTAYQTLSLLEGAVQRGTAKRIQTPDLTIAAKTGTSNKGKDHWFIAMTPENTYRHLCGT